ncbi:dTDP-4-dehydrorhamnose 3,5-epimerase [Neolewinella antarctica]|uniref:dTDP-4-dehydrorhamnose 3,5-epimerase n=1 Tax=Neolewinella antarctica TaxID=442734 RepID=A0ABX0XI84_9BACT|nr:dTDP-4-dehydrorhamnose 3,5-epimerase [Neolewinella antarctica]NJC28473.1 dTDP-4-dehydrorhamnose 3,5-epimerase [Neolewinella antarctica]
MPFITTPIAGLQLFQPRVFKDARGYFFESYNADIFKKAGINSVFVQDNQAKSGKGVLRALHRQTGDAAQAKLVRVIQGSVYDVAVDLRPGSPTLYEWYGCELSAENQQQLFVPRGFAHGYLVLSETAIFSYKCDNYYAPKTEAGLRYDDPAIGVEWPDLDVDYLVAKRDLEWPALAMSAKI